MTPPAWSNGPPSPPVGLSRLSTFFPLAPPFGGAFFILEPAGLRKASWMPNCRKAQWIRKGAKVTKTPPSHSVDSSQFHREGSLPGSDWVRVNIAMLGGTLACFAPLRFHCASRHGSTIYRGDGQTVAMALAHREDHAETAEATVAVLVMFAAGAKTEPRCHPCVSNSRALPDQCSFSGTAEPSRS